MVQREIDDGAHTFALRQRRAFNFSAMRARVDAVAFGRMKGPVFAALVVLSTASCSTKREIAPTFGVTSAPRWEYARAAPAWPSLSGALENEAAAARRAMAFGMVDPARLEPVQCSSQLGWRSGEVVFNLDGGAARFTDGQCRAGDPQDLRTLVAYRNQPVHDPVMRVLLLRTGTPPELLAPDSPSRIDRDWVVRAWGKRLWQGALASYSGRSEGARDDGVARAQLALLRFAIGQREREGAARTEVLALFPYAETARELDEQRWLEPSTSGGVGDPRREAVIAATFPSIAINGWRDAHGESTVELVAPSVCPPEVQRNRALRYRPTAAWFTAAERASVLSEWRALEGLLQRLHGGSALTRTVLAACDDREHERPARAYEVAYVLLSAALGYDALAPNELARFERGETRLLFELETRFRERINQMGASREALARAHLDQDATRVLWPSSARSLADFHRARRADASGETAMQRARDASRVLAAARSTERPQERCAMALDAIEIDPSASRDRLLSVARPVFRDIVEHHRPSAAGCAGKLLAQLQRLGVARAADELPAMLAALGDEVADVEPTELLASLQWDPMASGSWEPPDAVFAPARGADFGPARWMTRPALQLYARAPSLRSWASRALASREVLRPEGLHTGFDPCSRSRPFERREVMACWYWTRLPPQETARPRSIEEAVEHARATLDAPIH